MSDLSYATPVLGAQHLGPWTISGGPDPDFDDNERGVHHMLLTDANLLTCFRRRFPGHAYTHYDEMVRLLDYVWDCPLDRTANVVGFRCGQCGQTRAAALQRNETP
jgi:hypothetical protein